MKKKILSGLFALALLATAGLGVHKSLNGNANLSDLALANVEALANGESGGGGNTEKLVSYPCKNMNEGSGCGNIGQTGPSCSIKRYC